MRGVTIQRWLVRATRVISARNHDRQTRVAMMARWRWANRPSTNAATEKIQVSTVNPKPSARKVSLSYVDAGMFGSSVSSVEDIRWYSDAIAPDAYRVQNPTR